MKTETIATTLVVSCVAMLMLVGVSWANESDTTLILAADSAGNIFALDAPSESLLWSASIGGDARSLVVSDNGAYVAVGTSISVALLNKDGNVLWTKTVGVNPTDPAPPFQFDTRLVSRARHRRLHPHRPLDEEIYRTIEPN